MMKYNIFYNVKIAKKLGHSQFSSSHALLPASSSDLSQSQKQAKITECLLCATSQTRHSTCRISETVSTFHG